MKEKMLANEDRLEETMARHALDAIVGTSPENVLYLGDFWAMSQWVRRGPQAYAVRQRRVGTPIVVTSSALIDLVADQGVTGDIRCYSFFQTDFDESAVLSPIDQRQQQLFAAEPYRGPVEALVAALVERGLARARIGIDEIGITPQCMELLVGSLPEATFVRAFSILETVRSVKTAEEIVRLRRAAHVSEQAIEEALAAAHVGMTEIEMARVFHGCTVRLDGVPVTGCIGFGGRSALSNVQPSDRRLEHGDVIRFDVGCRYRHYRSDIARNAVVGTPSEKLRRYHRALLSGISRTYDVLKPGLKVSKLFDEVVETVRREGIPHFDRSHVGHGIGIEGYDPPNIAATSDGVFEENMVICVETPYYELGFAGLQVEDMILVTSTGAESLMARDGELRILS